VRHREIGRVLAAIHASPEQNWSVESLAEVMGASRSSFASKFTAIVGETPARYLAQVRMHQARLWIARDGARISDVAQRLGFDSDASFSRSFKRILGVPPSHYRIRTPAVDDAADLLQ
jgi:AraC-like DNA-binding protein